MRALLVIAVLFALTAPLRAAEFYASAPVTAATIYPDGAVVTRSVSVDLPAGQHRVIVPFDIDALEAIPRFEVPDGVVVMGTEVLRQVSVDPQALFTPQQTQAFDALTAARRNLRDKQDALRDTELQIEGIRARLAFLDSVAAPADMTANFEKLTELAELVEAGTVKANATIERLKRAIRDQQETLDELGRKVAAAQYAFDRLSPPEETIDMLAINLDVSKAGPVSLGYSTVLSDAAWDIDYDVKLPDGASGELVFSRNILVGQFSSEPWIDIDLILATLRPGDNTAPSTVYRNGARIHKPEPVIQAQEMGRISEPMVEAPVVVEEPSGAAMGMLQDDGIAVSYRYPFKVSIYPEQPSSLRLDDLRVPVETEIRAVPRRDDTAYLVARLTNTSGEPILPGVASLYRGETLVGRASIDLVPSGDEAEIGFGPVEAIRLDTIFDRRNQGDKGVFTRSNTRNEAIALVVENLSDETQAVKTYHALPFSEQDDLKVETRAVPAPDDTDVDDIRGKSAWNLTLAPGEKKEIRLEFTLDWPEGWELDWRP